MKHIFPLLTAVSAASAATHSLVYLYTILLGDYSHVPEFVVVGSVDDTPHVYFDSNTMRLVPKVDWMERFDAEYWETQTMGLWHHHIIFKNNIEIAIQRFNHSKKTGAHTYQRMVGCVWDDERGDTNGYDLVGYDGEDFIIFNLNTVSWIATNPTAFRTKLKWDSNQAENERERQYLIKECVGWLKKYLIYESSSLNRTAPPEVSVFQRSSSSPVTCHATGFYPRAVMLYWMKDGKDVLEDVSLEEVLPNSDGTFQIRSTLNVIHEELENHKFACVVDHQSLERSIVVPFERRHYETLIFIWVTVAGLLLIMSLVTCIILAKKFGSEKRKLKPFY